MGASAYDLRSNRRRREYMTARDAKIGGAAAATVALAAGAANVMGVTIQVVDEKGAAVSGVHLLDVYASESAVGAGVTGDAYSGDLVATAGTILGSVTAKKHWRVLTNANGLFTGNLTDTAKPQDQYIAVVGANGRVTVSAISATKFG